ncbi:hypothetical protein O7598_24195 [Micromonospora sp. WMMC241]|uniref:hypothetical protein n=1 Tax=Micromonospora sp. WMMC241 TaxID=3015159 RepID=UPI0022B6C0DE|nr:hypothetical protein [Micromonospora sp. WMMC241]MCZ7439526.1 hypothetical protein [Micromonospora sp. WMMC241]
MDDRPGDRPVWLQRDDPLVWEALEQWAASRGAVEVLSHGPICGYSGARLFVIKLNRPAGRGRMSSQKLLVKVHPAGGGQRPEASRHAEAWADAPGFAARHMVEQHHGSYPVADGRHLSFQDVANGGDPVRTLDEIDDDDQLVEAYRAVVVALLDDWNGGTESVRSTAPTTVREYVTRELAVTGALSEVTAAAGRLGLGDLGGKHVVFDGEELPNPLRLTEPGESGDDIDYVHGLAHGDLHGGNILFDARPDGTASPNTFTLIDFDRYENDAPLTRDLMALLLSTVLRWVAPRPGPDGRRPPGLPPKQADTLLNYLVHPGPIEPSSLPPVMARLVSLTYEVGQRYATSGGWRREWRRQYRLSLISQALTAVTHDNLGSEGHRWCFRLAACAAKAHHEDPVAAPTPPPPPPSPPPPSSPPPPPRSPSPSVDTSFLADAPIVDLVPRPWHAPGPRGYEARRFREPAPAGGDGGRTGRPGVVRPVGGTRGRHIAATAGTWPRRRRLVLPLTLVTALGSLVVYLVAEGASDQGGRPPITVPPPSRTETSPGRGGPREPAPAEPVDPGPKLDQMADRVARRAEPPRQGRFACTWLRVWSPAELTLGSDDLTRYREEWLWWTREGSGRRTVLDVDGGRRSQPQDVRYDRGDLTDVPPDPSVDLAELRAQVDELVRQRPPDVRNAAGTLMVVSWIYQFRPLTAPQRATLLRLLAETDGIVQQGRYPDRANRYGYAISAVDGAGRRETLQFDEETGRLLSHQTTSPDDYLVSYYLFLRSDRTDTIADARCAGATAVNIHE